MMMMKSFKFTSIAIRITLFKSYVLPMLQFASPVWNMQKCIDVNLLEKFLRCTSKSFLKCPYLVDYLERLQCCNMLSLAVQRHINDLCLVYKLLYDQSGILTLKKMNMDHSKSTYHNIHLLEKYSRTNRHRDTFTNHTIAWWNALPDYIQNSLTLSIFKRNLISFYNDNPI